MNFIQRALRITLGICGTVVIGYGLTLSAIGSQARWLMCLGGGGLLIALALWPQSRSTDTEENQPSINVIAAITFIFGLLAIQLARMQVFSSASLAGRSGVDPISMDVLSNPRAVNSALTIHRGSITDRNGIKLAESIFQKGRYVRRYPEVNCSYVCGYFSPLKYGAAGLEASYDRELRGAETGEPLRNEIDKLLGRTPQGASLRLTIDADLQTIAHQMLDDAIGSAILIEVATGAVLVLASNPHLDPNQLVAIDFDSATATTNYWAQLNADPTRPLLVRSTAGLYTPGSTFKTITASAAIETGIAGPEDTFTDDGQLNINGHIIVEENRPDDSLDTWTLSDGLAFSLNIVFARVGLALGAERLRTFAERFGFGQEISFDTPVAVGQVSSSSDFLENPIALADTSFGQGQLLTTPLGMALVAATLANGGIMMQPYMVDSIIASSGEIIKSANPSAIRRVVEESTAASMQQMMVNAVENGYASNAAIDGLLVGGKTGTAETGTDVPHSWFIGFAGDSQPKFAVAVVFEHGGVSSAGPISVARHLLLESIQRSR